MVDNNTEYYNSDYFEWQNKDGPLGGWVNKHFFQPTIAESDIVIDFGCGGGFLLANLKCKKKIGIEPNSTAKNTIESNRVEHYTSAQEALNILGHECVDVIISTNVLEHTTDPFNEISLLKQLLKKNGKIHFIVPCDSVNYLYNPSDINMHLYSWSPQNLGNLFKLIGFNIVYSKPLLHKWPPFRFLAAKFGWTFFNFCCLIFGRVSKKWSQTEILAIKN
jgi:SAM-dependent methyltransferase